MTSASEPRATNMETAQNPSGKRNRQSGRTASLHGSHCLRQASSPRKTKRKPKPKAAPTQKEIAAQVAERIAQLSEPPAAEESLQPAVQDVKVKSIAELRSTKVARLTTKIARNEAEISRLEREYLVTKQQLARENAALATDWEALTSSDEDLEEDSNDADPASATSPQERSAITNEAQDSTSRALEIASTRADDLLARFRGGEICETEAMDSLRALVDGALEEGCDVTGLTEMMESLSFLAGINRCSSSESGSKLLSTHGKDISCAHGVPVMVAAHEKAAASSSSGPRLAFGRGRGGFTNAGFLGAGFPNAPALQKHNTLTEREQDSNQFIGSLATTGTAMSGSGPAISSDDKQFMQALSTTNAGSSKSRKATVEDAEEDET